MDKFEIPNYLVFAGSWLAISWGVYRLFNIAGENINEQTKKDVSQWLMNLSIRKEYYLWPRQFIELFDTIFSNKHWSWRCFSRSLITSTIVFLIIIFVSNIIYTLDDSNFSLFPLIDPFQNSFNSGANVLKELVTDEQIQNDVIKALGVVLAQVNNLPTLILSSFLVSLLFNVIPDFISLLETRFVLGKMSKSVSITKISAFLLIDILLTFFIFIALLLILNLMFNGGFGKSTFFVKKVFDGIFFQSIEPEMKFSILIGASFYTTFFTSFWIWTYFISSLIIKLISSFDFGLKIMKKHFLVETQPFKTMGFFLMIMVTFFYIFLGLHFFI